MIFIDIYMYYCYYLLREKKEYFNIHFKLKSGKKFLKILKKKWWGYNSHPLKMLFSYP